MIARIPKSGCITRANCAHSDAISKLRVSMGGDEQWLAILGAALLLERTSFSDSRWAPYLAALPREESDVVASWPDDRRRFLAGTDIEQALRDERAQARSEWDGHVAKVVRDATSDVDDDSRPGFDDYLAARSVVSSRAFTVDDAVGVGLVPVADMFNHRTGGNHVCVADVEDASAIPAAARSAAGEPSMYVRVVSPANADDEVFNTYGELGNAKLLSSYGFAQRDNPADRVTLGVPALRAAAAMRGVEGASMASRLAWCERAGVLRDATEFHLSSEEPPPRELLLAIWILTANEEAFRTVRAAGEAARDDGETDVGARVAARAESIVGGGLRTSAANAVFAEALRRRRALYAEPPGGDPASWKTSLAILVASESAILAWHERDAEDTGEGEGNEKRRRVDAADSSPADAFSLFD